MISMRKLNKENPQIDYFAINRDNMPWKALSNQFGYLEDRKG